MGNTPTTSRPGTVRTLLERDDELAALAALVSAAASGEGRVLAVEGAPGIGKTSVLLSARELARTAGFTVLDARGAELEQAFSFGVVLQLLDSPVRADRSPTLWSGAAGLARRLFEPDALAQPLEPASEIPTLYGLYWLLSRLAERRPLLLTIDDLQWVDRASLRMLGFLARRIDGLPIAVAVATRHDVNDDRRLLLAEINAEFSTVLRPAPLTGAAVRELLRRRLGSADAALAEACARATAGNPFYLDALLAELTRLPGEHRPEDVEGVVSRTVSLAILRRLAGLSDAASAFAHAVAVAGDGVPSDLTSELAGLDRKTMEEALAELTAVDLLKGGERPAYAHPIARAAVYGELDRSTRERLHARAALILVRAAAAPDRVAAQLLQAAPGSIPAATDILTGAARRAMERGAPDSAALYLRRALREPDPQWRRAELAAELGLAAARAGLHDAEACLRRALEDAPTEPTRIELALDLGRLLAMSGRGTEAVDALERAARRPVRAGVAALHRLRAEMLAIGDLDLSVRAHAQDRGDALAPPDPAEDPTVQAMLLAHEATSAIMRCAPAGETAELARRALADGALFGAGVAGIQLAHLAAYFLMCADCFGEAEAFLDRVLATARRTGSATAYAAASAWRSFVAHRRGALAEAEAHAQSGLDLARSLNLQLVEVVALVNLSWTLVDRGAPQAAAAEFERASHSPEDWPGFLGATSLEARGRMRLALGERRRGLQDLLDAGRRISAYGLDNPACFAWRSAAAPALAADGRRTEAVTLASREVELARRWGAPRALGLALRVQAVVDDAQALALRERR